MNWKLAWEKIDIICKYQKRIDTAIVNLLKSETDQEASNRLKILMKTVGERA